MIVVATNVVAYLCIGGDLAGRAERLLLADNEWHAPRLWRSELRNVLSGLIRRGMVDLGGALGILAEAEVLLAGREHEVPSEEVLALVAGSDCSAYDCEFVALALRLEVPLLTHDGRVLAAFPRIARSMAAFLDDSA